MRSAQSDALRQITSSACPAPPSNESVALTLAPHLPPEVLRRRCCRCRDTEQSDGSGKAAGYGQLCHPEHVMLWARWAEYRPRPTCSTACNASKTLGSSPPEQCAIPGAMNKRYEV